jgi:hypothetical protein
MVVFEISTQGKKRKEGGLLPSASLELFCFDLDFFGKKSCCGVFFALLAEKRTKKHHGRKYAKIKKKYRTHLVAISQTHVAWLCQWLAFRSLFFKRLLWARAPGPKTGRGPLHRP